MTKRYYTCEETHRTVNGVKLKRCTKCKRWKEISEFCGDSARKDGLRVYCKSCSNVYALKRYRKDKKPVRDYLRYEDRHRVVRGLREKLCSGCKQWKYYNDFSKSRRTKDGLSFKCKECERARSSYKRKGSTRYLHYEERHRTINGIKQKFCHGCGKWRNEDEFYKNKLAGDGLGNWCRECIYKAAGKPYKPKGRGVRRNFRYEERHRIVNGVRQKYCRNCKRWKNEDEFYWNRPKKDGLSNRCQKCHSESLKKLKEK
jgi:hypothetical protein